MARIAYIRGAIGVECDSQAEVNELIEASALPNPAFQTIYRITGTTPYHLPRSIFFSKTNGPRIVELPLHFPMNIGWDRTHDERVLAPVKFKAAHLELRPYQRQLVGDALQELRTAPQQSVLCSASTGAGKTIIGLEIARRLGQKTLVVVNSGLIRDAWIEDCIKFLGFRPGIIQRSTVQMNTHVVVAMNQSLVAKRGNMLDHLKDQFGTVIVDEVHHAPAQTFTETLWTNHAAYRIGLSATPTRPDTLAPAIRWMFGRTLEAESNQRILDVDRHRIIYVPYRGQESFDTKNVYRFIWSYVEDEQYWDMVADKIIEEHNQGRVCVAVVRTVNHSIKRRRTRLSELAALEQALRRKWVVPSVLYGRLIQRQRKKVLERIRSGASRILISTIALIEEGANIQPLSSLFICSPFWNPQKMTQLLGRIRREWPGKTDARATQFCFDVPLIKRLTNKGVKECEALSTAHIIHEGGTFHDHQNRGKKGEIFLGHPIESLFG